MWFSINISASANVCHNACSMMIFTKATLPFHLSTQHPAVRKPSFLLVYLSLYCQLAKSLASEIIISTAAAAAKSLQSCPTLCDPRDGSPPGSPVPGILQAITLEWVAISTTDLKISQHLQWKLSSDFGSQFHSHFDGRNWWLCIHSYWDQKISQVTLFYSISFGCTGSLWQDTDSH